MKLVLGIDIGGTKIALVLTDTKGRVLRTDEFLIFHNKASRATIQELIKRILILTKGNKLIGIGVGTPGPVNPKSGKIPWSPNLPGWQGLPICRILHQKFHVPVFIENDANLAAVCEKRLGFGKGKKDLVYITVSTGIGGGLIFNGNLYSGHSYSGGEFGHMTVVPGGRRCHCGKHGCLEAYASGTAIAKEARTQIPSNPKSLLAKLKKENRIITSKRVKEAAHRGDRLAIKILEEAGRYLGVGIGNLLNLLNPEVIILGGGVLKGSGKGIKIFWRSMIQSAKKESWREPFRNSSIVRTKFQDSVGALGAVSLVLEQLNLRNNSGARSSTG